MTKPQSPIHRPLEDADPPAVPPPTRIARIAALDMRQLSGRQHFLGAGGASGVYYQAVRQALTEEVVEQLRGSGAGDSSIGKWAAEIIAVFEE